MKNGKIQTFTDLNVWREGHKLVLLVYKITKNFPKEETYSLVDQMRRAAELKNFILIAKDVGYFKDNEFEDLVNQSNVTHQILQGFIQKTKTFVNRKS